MSIFQDGSHGDVQCGKCPNIGVNYEPQYIRTQNIMIIQLYFIDDGGTKLESKCSPVQNLDININGQ